MLPGMASEREQPRLGSGPRAKLTRTTDRQGIVSEVSWAIPQLVVHIYIFHEQISMLSRHYYGRNFCTTRQAETRTSLANKRMEARHLIANSEVCT